MMMDLVEIVKDVLVNVLHVQLNQVIVYNVLLWEKVEDLLQNALVNLDILKKMESVKNVL